MSVFIIAEVGINHNGDIDIAKKMVDEAKRAGADCVKFQTFKADEFISDPKQTYTYKSRGREITESMLEMFRRYEFSKDEWVEIVEYCTEKDILFSSTAQNGSDLDFLLSIANLPFIKVGSDDLSNLEQLKYYASKQLPMVISAGMAYASEIEDAVESIKEMGNDDITVLHCTSSYPTRAADVNLRKIPVIRDAFGVKVGFSDHTIGSAAAVGAVCMGAEVIEKHFTLDNDMEGPDHWFSINPDELKRYVGDIRFASEALGSSVLKPTEEEMEMRKMARRKIVAAVDIVAGSVIGEDMLLFKRAEEDGLPPKYRRFLVGRRVKNKIFGGETVTLEKLL